VVLNEIIDKQKGGMIMAIGDICNRDVVIAERKLSVVEAARLMRGYHVGDLVVVEKMKGRNRPVGIVTDRDIVVEVVAAAVAPDTLAVRDIMGQELATVQESEGVFEAMRYMRTKGVRRMPVVDREGGLVGIVTLDDLLTLLAEEMTELAGLVSRERQREESVRK
jgi:CBS domain-containing protein